MKHILIYLSIVVSIALLTSFAHATGVIHLDGEIHGFDKNTIELVSSGWKYKIDKKKLGAGPQYLAKLKIQDQVKLWVPFEAIKTAQRVKK